MSQPPMKILDPDKHYELPEPQTRTEQLVRQLYAAAANWYKTKNPEYIKQYHDLYNELRALGWDDSIDDDAQLPDQLMPQEYLKQVAQAEADYLNQQRSGLNHLDLEK